MTENQVRKLLVLTDLGPQEIESIIRIGKIDKLIHGTCDDCNWITCDREIWFEDGNDCKLDYCSNWEEK